MPASNNAPIPATPGRIAAVKRRARQLVGTSYTAQGEHLDPLNGPPPPFTGWSRDEIEAFHSPEMDAFRAGLPPADGGSIRDGVVGDLSTFYDLPPDECARRAVNWEAWSVDEWSSADRSTPDGLRQFYRTTASWSFDLLWYAYLQAEGYGEPMSVTVARFLRDRGVRSGVHLDFGSGVGATSQLFEAMGFETTLADVADGMLAFARFRLERRGSSATFLNLNHDELPTARFDAVTAFDVLAHVPDLDVSLDALWRSIKPGGWLFATFDVRPATAESAWHLYDEEWDLCAQVLEAGFTQRAGLGTVRCYQRLDQRTSARWRAAALYRNPVLRAARRGARSLEVRLRHR